MPHSVTPIRRAKLNNPYYRPASVPQTGRKRKRSFGVSWNDWSSSSSTSSSDTSESSMEKKKAKQNLKRIMLAKQELDWSSSSTSSSDTSESSMEKKKAKRALVKAIREKNQSTGKAHKKIRIRICYESSSSTSSSDTSESSREKKAAKKALNSLKSVEYQGSTLGEME